MSEALWGAIASLVALAIGGVTLFLSKRQSRADGRREAENDQLQEDVETAKRIDRVI